MTLTVTEPRTCSVDGCEAPVHGHGWCRHHYAKWYRYGDPVSEHRWTSPNKGTHATHCPHGHPYDGPNTFIGRNGGHWCRTCQELNRKKCVSRKRALMLIAKGNRCSDCGGEFMSRELHFHHRDPSTKVLAVALLVRHSERALRDEIAKCDVLCATCHRSAHR
jgi:hypothetical protein